MISQVTFTVEHGETTDPFVSFIASVSPSSVPGATILDYTISVDVSEDSF